MSSTETRDNCRSPLELGVALDRLQRLSRRGKLAGFRTVDGTTCEAAVFGTIYDRVMRIDLEPDGTGTRLTMTTRLKKRMPIIVIIVMALAIWPGVWMTDSMLTTYFSWYPKAFWVTCAWYLPLTLLGVPALWMQFKASQAAAAEHGAEVAQKIADAVDGTLETSAQ